MSPTRVLYVLTVLAIALAAAIALDPTTMTKAASRSERSQPSLRGQPEGLSALSAHADALNDQPQADRSYDAIENLHGGPSEDGSSLDPATRGYIAWAKMIEEQKLARADRSFHTPETSTYQPAQGSRTCLDDECTYKLPDGRSVK